jgi:hypothetical protein
MSVSLESIILSIVVLNILRWTDQDMSLDPETYAGKCRRTE